MIVGAKAIAQASSGAARTTTTDYSGVYSFANLPSGDYTINASAPSLILQQPAKIALRSGDQNLDLQLTVFIPEQNITVQENNRSAVSTNTNSNASAQVLRGEDLDALGDLFGHANQPSDAGGFGFSEIQLQNEPGAQGYIIGYGSCSAEGVSRANRAKNYLVNSRGLDDDRIVAVDGGCMANLVVQLWVVPRGAKAPTGNVVELVSPCPKCRIKPTRRRGSRKTN